MWPKRIVFFSPHFNEDLGFPKRPEIGGIQALGSQFPIERLALAVLPRAAGFNELKPHLSPSATFAGISQ